MAYSAAAIANAFFSIAAEKDKQLTNMQLQKLVFIAHGYALALIDEPLYKEKTLAWQWGPVIPDLYEKLRVYGRYEVTDKVDSNDSVAPDTQQKAIIQAVWDTYGDLSAYQLSAITHEPDTPWTKVWDDNKFGVITDPQIKNYYKNILS